MADLGLLLIRLVVGLLFAVHGVQKLFGWFGGHGFKSTTQMFAGLGLRPAWLMALLAGAGETLAGLLLAAGLWLPVAAFLFIVTMAVAVAKVTWSQGLRGYEYSLVLAAVAIGLALVGPGTYAL